MWPFKKKNDAPGMVTIIELRKELFKKELLEIILCDLQRCGGTFPNAYDPRNIEEAETYSDFLRALGK